MPTFCRHNRFIERCAICSKTLPTYDEPKPKAPRKRAASPAHGEAQTKRPGQRERLRVHHEERAEDDGYRSPLLPGLRSSHDADRLVEEISFSSARLQGLEQAPVGLYADVRAQRDIEQATWTCFLIGYISPLQAEDPFAGIRLALEQAGDWRSEAMPELERIELGPRTAHDPRRGTETIAAYRRWAEQASSQAAGFGGEPAWSAERRFERVFERLALPGFGRLARFDLLLTLGALGLYELEADSLHLLGAPGRSASDATTLAAKRVFGIGDAVNLERRSLELARAISVPVGALDLALWNWASGERVTLGFPAEIGDQDALIRGRDALGL